LPKHFWEKLEERSEGRVKEKKYRERRSERWMKKKRKTKKMSGKV